MKLIYPDFYKRFRCLAGDCPDTCCAQWEVVIDEDTLETYNALSDELGARIRATITELGGDLCFATVDGRCPHLTEDKLCALLLATNGDETILCKTCREHPRFFEEYGDTREVTLSLSCPAAARLLLEREAPITFLTETAAEPSEPLCGADAALDQALRRARDTALALLQNRLRPVGDRLALLLLLGTQVQRLVDDGRLYRLPRLLNRFERTNEQERMLLRLRRLRKRDASFFPAWLLLSNMEHLTGDFPALAARTPRTVLPHHSFDREYAIELEHLAVYFLFRWFRKALNDDAVLARAGECVFHVLAIRQLWLASGRNSHEDFLTLCGLYSKEVEHSEDNLAMLHRALKRGTLRWQTLAAML